jgi:hypothetical protein
MHIYSLARQCAAACRVGQDIGDEGEEVVDEKVADVVQVVGHDEERRTVPQLACLTG